MRGLVKNIEQILGTDFQLNFLLPHKNLEASYIVIQWFIAQSLNKYLSVISLSVSYYQYYFNTFVHAYNFILHSKF